jgi:hypothetical protein
LEEGSIPDKLKKAGLSGDFLSCQTVPLAGAAGEATRVVKREAIEAGCDSLMNLSRYSM